jgi:hypothetical protein
MKTARRAILLISLIIVVACTQRSYLSLVDASDPAKPVLCISTKPDCNGQSPSLANILVVELKESENYQPNFRNAVWLAQPRQGESTGSADKIIHYGIPPSTLWESKIDPQPLRPLTLYGVDDAVYFYWYESNGAPKYALYLWEDREKGFAQFKMLVNQPTKGI